MDLEAPSPHPPSLFKVSYLIMEIVVLLFASLKDLIRLEVGILIAVHHQVRIILFFV